MGEAIQHTKQQQTDITVYVYAGKDGEFILYDDEHTNYNYEKGSFANIKLSYNDRNKTLTIGERSGQYDGMPEELNFKAVLVNRNRPVGIDDAVKAEEVVYNGKETFIRF